METIMKTTAARVLAGLCTLAMACILGVPAGAQMSEVKEKPRLYSYVAFWSIPRSQWAELDKANAADQKVLDKMLASGTIVGYGNDENLVHQPDGYTHDGWWSAMSMAGLLNVLDQFYKNGSVTAPVMSSATKHADEILVSRYYNWHSGSWKDVYTHVSSYKLKADAPDDAVDILSKNLFVPLLEKQLADGTIHEYEIDTEAIHTDAPGTITVVYLAANAEGLDKVAQGVRDTVKANPLAGPAFSSMIDDTPHRDYLVRTSATYK
jgi:hypothetical protein